MASFEAHCAESVKLSGAPCPEAHSWLDAFAGTAAFGFRHRRKRHQAVGVREAVALFGEAAGPVARRHVERDTKEEGWRKGVDHFPKDEADYLRMGLF